MVKHYKLMLIVGIITITGFFLFFESEQDIIFSEPIMKCDYNKTRWECSVSFDLTNKSPSFRAGKLSIRGMGYKQKGKIKAIILAEDKFIDFEIPGKKTMTIREVITSEREPKTVAIKIIEKKYVD